MKLATIVFTNLFVLVFERENGVYFEILLILYIYQCFLWIFGPLILILMFFTSNDDITDEFLKILKTAFNNFLLQFL